jgi:TatD-related deoxyribonuclease
VPLPGGLPVVDHHCHLSPDGEGIEAVRRFGRAGGTHLFLATQNYGGAVPRTLEEYGRQFEETYRLADRARSVTGVVVFPVVAPYPVDLVRAVGELGISRALDLHRSALDLAGRAVRERRAVAIGEVGRPHFPVPSDVAAAVEEAFGHALTVARDAGCPAIVHCGDLDAAGYLELAGAARRAGLAPERIVKHYARSRVPAEERGGVVPSYLARRELVNEVLVDDAPWFLETDFLDDPRRPGAVLDLATVPRRAAAIAARAGGADRLFVPFVESVERLYGLHLEAPADRAA